MRSVSVACTYWNHTNTYWCGVLKGVEENKSRGFTIWVWQWDALHGQWTTLQRLLCFMHIMQILDMLRYCREALISLKKCCQDVFDLGSESLLWWVCLVADNKNLLRDWKTEPKQLSVIFSNTMPTILDNYFVEYWQCSVTVNAAVII